MSSILWWLFGFLVSVGFGAMAIQAGLSCLRQWITQKAKDENIPIPEAYLRELYIPGWLIGIIERVTFTFLVAFDVSGTAAAMFAWVALKMATDWNRLTADVESIGARSLGLSTLVGDIVSLLFALVGGLICRQGR